MDWIRLTKLQKLGLDWIGISNPGWAQLKSDHFKFQSKQSRVWWLIAVPCVIKKKAALKLIYLFTKTINQIPSVSNSDS